MERCSNSPYKLELACHVDQASIVNKWVGYGRIQSHVGVSCIDVVAFRHPTEIFILALYYQFLQFPNYWTCCLWSQHFTWFLYCRYIDELSNQLKKEFPLASPTEKDDGINKDNVVHIYYKVQILDTIDLRCPLYGFFFRPFHTLLVSSTWFKKKWW